MFKNKIKFEGKTVKNVRQSFFILCTFLGTLQKISQKAHPLSGDCDEWQSFFFS